MLEIKHEIFNNVFHHNSCQPYEFTIHNQNIIGLVSRSKSFYLEEDLGFRLILNVFLKGVQSNE